MKTDSKTTHKFPILGIHCASCKAVIENKVRKLEEIESVEVNFATEIMTIVSKNKINIDKVRVAVESAGNYKLVSFENQEEKIISPAQKELLSKRPTTLFQRLKSRRYQKYEKKLIGTAILTIPFVFIILINILSLIFNFEVSNSPLGFIGVNGYEINTFYFLQFLLSTIILVWGGSYFYKSAWKSIRSGFANMDTLISLGITVSWSFSTFITFFPNTFENVSAEVFFESTAFIIFFVLLGRLLEHRAKDKTNADIKKLINLQVHEAAVIENDVEKILPINEVKIGDNIIVGPNEKVPLDGIIIEGNPTIDESVITGESYLDTKSIGDKVIGSTLNKDGSFVFEVTQTQENTMLSKIVKMIEGAQNTNTQIQKIVDNISRVFVPFVLLLSVIMFVFWFFLATDLNLYSVDDNSLAISTYISISILVIACPCALGLAIPTATSIGSGRSALRGILLKHSETLENTHKLKTLVFDKTGTLTYGKLKVNDFLSSKRLNSHKLFKDSEDKEDMLLTIAGSIEHYSKHPMSIAIEKKAHEEHSDNFFNIDDFETIYGKGVKGTYKNAEILIGNLQLLKDAGVKLDNELDKQKQKLSEEGKTIVSIAVDKEELGVFALSDEIKKEAKDSVDKIKDLGIGVAMLTGDSFKSANYIAQKLGIDIVISDVSPDQKAEYIRRLQDLRIQYVRKNIDTDIRRNIIETLLKKIIPLIRKRQEEGDPHPDLTCEGFEILSYENNISLLHDLEANEGLKFGTAQAEYALVVKKELIISFDLDQEKNIVGMVGDGVNDAPALNQSDIGIAMGNGTDITIDSADAILINGNLSKLIDYLEISKQTFNVIKQNLFWVFIYNFISIPIAAGILYPSFGILLSPIIASAAMALSSITVVLNSLRLRNL